MYCNNSDSTGYFIGTSSNPTTTDTNNGQWPTLNTSNNLYFPVIEGSDKTGQGYWLAAPGASQRGSKDWLASVSCNGIVHSMGNSSYGVSFRPVIRLKSNVVANKDANGVWQLQ